MQFSRDVETWRGYLSRMERDWLDYVETGGHVWLDTWHGGGSFERAFVGPWPRLRRHVTREFRQWVEESGMERVTLRTWVERQRAERERERIEYQDWLDAQPF